MTDDIDLAQRMTDNLSMAKQVAKRINGLPTIEDREQVLGMVTRFVKASILREPPTVASGVEHGATDAQKAAFIRYCNEREAGAAGA